MAESYLTNEVLGPLRRQAAGGDVWEPSKRDVNATIDLDDFAMLDMLATVYRVTPSKLAGQLLIFAISEAVSADSPVQEMDVELREYMETARLQEACALRLSGMRDRWRSGRVMERDLPKLPSEFRVIADPEEVFGDTERAAEDAS